MEKLNIGKSIFIDYLELSSGLLVLYSLVNKNGKNNIASTTILQNSDSNVNIDSLPP
ncbi:hypothetical protein QEW_0928 [Clostridioides difficile CD160]|nr:hypothetical protein QEW_0928 [Clostridioides difficile CD160]